MANKKNTTMLVIGGIVVIALFLYMGGGFDFGGTQAITGLEIITRTAPPQVLPGESFTVNYLVTGASGKWGATVEEAVSGGCVFSISGEQKTSLAFAMVSDLPNPLTYTVIAPSSGSCTFIGDYMFGSSSIVQFPNAIVTVCQPSTCVGLGYGCGTYSDNCGGTLSCGSCTAPDVCTSGQCVCQADCGVTRWALEDDCATTMSDGCGSTCTRTVTQNTGADTNCNNIVDRAELGFYITDWVNNIINRISLGNAIQAWVEG